MSKVVGIVSEGPTDYLALKTIIDKITGEEHTYLPLQPESDLMGRYGNGWKGVLNDTISMSDKERIIITVPCDSTDAWVVAAYDELENVERIEDPWRNIIAKRKYYHDVRVRGEKKSTSTYKIFAEQIANNWDLVKEKCYSARLLEQEVQKVFL